MLLSVIKYSGIYAKTKALGGDLLTEEDYSQLANCKTLENFAENLEQRKSYVEVIQLYKATIHTRTALERNLIQSLYRDFGALYSFMTSEKERKYFEILFLKHEIGLVKTLLRMQYDKSYTDVLTEPFFNKAFQRHTGLDIEKLMRSDNFKEFLEGLEGTQFYGVLSKINKENPSLVDFETQLDFYCYLQTWNYLQKHLDSVDKKSQARINGSESDLHNIIWIYRAKKYYELEETEILPYLIPIGYKLNRETVKGLIHAEDDTEFLDVLKGSYYRNVFTTLSIGEMERALDRYMQNVYRSERKKNPYSMSTITSYIYFKSEEIKNLTTLIECMKYQLSPEESLKKLSISLSKSERTGGRID